jgi:hypothetical protein
MSSTDSLLGRRRRGKTYTWLERYPMTRSTVDLGNAIAKVEIPTYGIPILKNALSNDFLVLVFPFHATEDPVFDSTGKGRGCRPELSCLTVLWIRVTLVFDVNKCSQR